jgi:hypothetical protein
MNEELLGNRIVGEDAHDSTQATETELLEVSISFAVHP